VCSGNRVCLSLFLVVIVGHGRVPVCIFQERSGLVWGGGVFAGLELFGGAGGVGWGVVGLWGGGLLGSVCGALCEGGVVLFCWWTAGFVFLFLNFGGFCCLVVLLCSGAGAGPNTPGGGECWGAGGAANSYLWGLLDGPTDAAPGGRHAANPGRLGPRTWGGMRRVAGGVGGSFFV